MSPEDVSSVLELNPGQLQVLQEVLSALSLSNSTDPRGPAQLGQELIYLHELSLFLFCQLFSKEAQRPDSMEFWPAPEAPGAASSMSIGDLMSPTRGHTARSPGGGERASSGIHTHVYAVYKDQQACMPTFVSDCY